MQYSKELKESIIAEVREIKSLSVVSRKHGVAASTISGWISKESKKIQYKLDSSKKDLKVENKTLRKKLADTELELLIIKDLLKKSYLH